MEFLGLLFIAGAFAASLICFGVPMPQGLRITIGVLNLLFVIGALNAM